MPETPEITKIATDLVTFDIIVENDAITQKIEIFSIDVWQEVNRIPRAKIVILDGDPAKETFSVSEEDWFIPGKEIKIRAGYHSDNETIFEGIVTSQAIKVRRNGNNMFTVECSHKAVKMTSVPKSRYFYNIKESDVFQEIINGYAGLEGDIEATEHIHTELLQFQSTDWDFMLSRADVNGFFCLLDEGNITLTKPDFSGATVQTITYGRNLLEIDAEMDVSTQISGVKSRSWDYSKTEPSEIEGKTSTPAVPGNLSKNDLSSVFQHQELELQSGTKVPVEILQSWANSKLVKHKLAKNRGRARVQGTLVLPGNIIELEGLGARFNGKAFVSGVRHALNGGEWTTDIQYGLSPEWFSQQRNISSQPALGMLPAVSGLQVGLVTQIQGDPQGDERILVRLPMIDAEEQGVWARLATLGAGNERGVVIRPEVDDEVIVGFIHDDPNHPVILGSVHSANNKAPIEASDENNNKGWVTRSGIKMMIDEKKPSIKMETPAGHSLHFDDSTGEIKIEDSNGNQILLNADGITLESSRDLTLKSNGNINISGINVNAEATATFKAEGGAGAEISSGAATTVKGSIVKIN